MKNLKKVIALVLVIVSLAGFLACSRSEDEASPEDEIAGDLTILQGTYTADLTLDASKKYLLKGFVYIQAPAKLTIPAGTIIKGDKFTKGTLIIERGAKIFAAGESNNPIVFTSNQPVGQRSYGDWGGVIILGNAQENQPGTPIIEGGVDRPFGGNDDTDNSGVFKYVRIEFPGIAFQPNNEINGLTLGSVGNGTEIHHVQVSFSGDDSFEWFGGTVNVKNLIAFRGWDDDFDADFGYRGQVQYGLAIRDKNIADVSGSNGFEVDNDATGTNNAPFTAPVFSNITIFGPLTTTADNSFNTDYKRGAHLRRNSAASIFNSIIMGYPDAGLFIDGTGSASKAVNGDLVIQNTILAGHKTKFKGNETPLVDGTAVENWYLTPVFNNVVFNENTEITGLTVFSQLNLTAPILLPANNSVVLTGASFIHPKVNNNFFDQVAFRGAFGQEDWTIGWTNFDPQNTVY